MDINIFWVLIIGLSAGILSGLFGIGGGLIIVPALLFMGFNQHAASGTSLVALLLPVGLLGVLEYYFSGKITLDNIKYGLLIALGLFLGAYFGSKISVNIPSIVLKKSFGFLLLIISIKILFFEK
jgi:hypothetical protein